jgi:transcriptional regulator GlxA family with amidase domain
VVTSAGTAAAIDCCLHLVRADHGAEIASRLARRLVVAPHRFGNQAQFIERPLANEPADQTWEIIEWLRERLGEPITINDLATRFHLSRRSLTRHFRATTGTTLLHWLLAERILAARELLETTMLPVATVARCCGFGSAVSMRQHFQRALKMSPQEYRKTFRP